MDPNFFGKSGRIARHWVLVRTVVSRTYIECWQIRPRRSQFMISRDIVWNIPQQTKSIPKWMISEINDLWLRSSLRILDMWLIRITDCLASTITSPKQPCNVFKGGMAAESSRFATSAESSRPHGGGMAIWCGTCKKNISLKWIRELKVVRSQLVFVTSCSSYTSEWDCGDWLSWKGIEVKLLVCYTTFFKNFQFKVWESGFRWWWRW